MVALSNSPSPTTVAMPAGSVRASLPVIEAPHGAMVSSPPSANLALPKKAEIHFDSELMMANMKEAVSRLNEMMQSGGRGLNFAMDNKLGRPVVTVTNTQTGEVVRTIPNEVIIRVGHSIEDLKGLLHDQRL